MILDYFREKTDDKIFKEIPKASCWGHFGSFLPKFRQKRIFLGKRVLSVFKYSNYLPSDKKSKKGNDPSTRKITNSQTDGWRVTQTDHVILWEHLLGRGFSVPFLAILEFYLEYRWVHQWWEVVKVFLHGESERGLNIHSKFSKVNLRGISNIKRNAFLSDRNRNRWSELFRGTIFFIPFNEFLRSLNFLEKI